MNRAGWLVNIIAIDSTVGKPSVVYGVKGIRAARGILGDRLGSTLQRSKEAWEAALEELPYTLGSHDSQERALEAARAAETESLGVLRCEIISAASGPQNASGSAGIKVYEVEVCDDCGNEATKPNDNCQHQRTTFKDAVLIENVPEPMPFEWDAIACAMTTLVAASGNLSLPSLANTYAHTYGRHVAPDFWSDVSDVLEAVFPPEAS